MVNCGVPETIPELNFQNIQFSQGKQATRDLICCNGLLLPFLLQSVIIFSFKGQPFGSIGIQIESVPILVLHEPDLHPVPTTKFVP